MNVLGAIKEAIILGLVALLPATFAWAGWQVYSNNLAPYEAVLGDARFLDQNVVWVDARAMKEYKKGHITGAVLLNEEEWDSLLGSLFETWQPDRPIVVYCNAGCESSEKIALRLRDMGIEPVYYLRGGYDVWKKTQ